MNRRSSIYLSLIVTLLSVVFGGYAHAASTPKVSPADKLKAALASAKTVFYIEQDVNMVGSAVDDPTPYKTYAALYAGIQGMNRYQLLPSAAGSDLIFADTRANLNILDGQTLHLIGTLYINPFDLTAKKYAADLVKQLVKLAGPSKSSSPLVQQSLLLQAPAKSKLDPPTQSALPAVLATAHTVYILDQGTFPAPNKENYQPGQMVEMLGNDLTDWGRHQIVPTLVGADLIVTFTTDNGCVATGTTTTERVGHTKTDVPDVWCKNKPSVGLRFLNPKTLQIIGYVWIDQPDMTIKPGQPDPKYATFQELIAAWKSKLITPAP